MLAGDDVIIPWTERAIGKLAGYLDAEGCVNTWPEGYRHAIGQSEHEAWNARHYPGTRQLCSVCDEPTGRCEDDSMLTDDGDPLCEACWIATLADPPVHPPSCCSKS